MVIERRLSKRDSLGLAEATGLQGATQTSQLLPLSPAAARECAFSRSQCWRWRFICRPTRGNEAPVDSHQGVGAGGAASLFSITLGSGVARRRWRSVARPRLGRLLSEIGDSWIRDSGRTSAVGSPTAIWSLPSRPCYRHFFAIGVRGNLAVSAVQFVSPLVITASSMYLQNAGFIGLSDVLAIRNDFRVTWWWYRRKGADWPF